MASERADYFDSVPRCSRWIQRRAVCDALLSGGGSPDRLRTLTSRAPEPGRLIEGLEELRQADTQR